jgi:hypothetical protein
MQVIDDFFPEEQFKELQEAILGQKMPWHYIPNISVPDYLKVDDPLAVDTPAIAFKLFDIESKIETEEFVFLQKYFIYLLHKLGYAKENLVRIRAVTTWPTGLSSEYYNIPHVDYAGKHKSIIFYLNDADGDTRLFHQKQKPVPWRLSEEVRLNISPNSEEEQKNYGSMFITSGFTVENTVSPKANRLLIFDGLTYHTAGHPVNCDRRVIINMNVNENVETVYD